jgi:putative sigma-54 modulation protein
MNITVTFRHVDASKAIKDRATEKFAKLQKFLRQPMTARVTVSLEKLLHKVEAGISSGGEHYEAHETTEDMYASIDKVLEKLERQIRGTKGTAKAKKRRSGESLRLASPPEPRSERPLAEPVRSVPKVARKKTKVVNASKTATAKSR